MTTTTIQMTSGLSFGDIQTLMQRAVGGNFTYELRCLGTNGPAVHAEFEVLGMEEEDQVKLTKLFADSVRPILASYFGKFEIINK